jgi:hypothetical protein
MRATPSVTPVQQGKLPSATAAEQHADSSGNPGANHTDLVERMRPPPPPSFSEWRNQQQSSKVQENHTPGAVGNATAQPRIPPAHNSEPTHTVAPAPQNGAHPNLPGEPAMKLRPATVASDPSELRMATDRAKSMRVPLVRARRMLVTPNLLLHAPQTPSNASCALHRMAAVCDSRNHARPQSLSL